MSHPSPSDGSPTLPAATIRSDALILATICEQLRVECTRPAYARLGGAADPLAATLATLYALREEPDRPDAVAVLMESLERIEDVGQHMRAVADDTWTTQPLNSAPKLNAYGQRDKSARPIDTLIEQVRAKHAELRALSEEPESIAPHLGSPYLESLDD